MIGTSAQISLYPLGQQDLGPAIQDVVDVLSEHHLPYTVGSMSTVTWGDDESLFSALREGYARACQRGGAVMIITISNACPLPSPVERGGDDA